MRLVCPYCRQTAPAKGLKPGRFKTKCAKCRKPFLVVVPETPGARPSSLALKGELVTAPVPAAVAPGQTVEPGPSDDLFPKLDGTFLDRLPDVTREPLVEAASGAFAWEPSGTFGRATAEPLEAPPPLWEASEGSALVAELGPSSSWPALASDASVARASATATAALEPWTFAATCPGLLQELIVTVPLHLRPTVAAWVGATAGAAATGSFSETIAHSGVNDTVARPASAFPATESATRDHAQPSGNRPSQLGGYAISGSLGVGGMGAVYLARQLSLDRPVALKVMRDEWASDPTFLARFTREAYAAAQLTHHNVVRIYDFGEDRSVHYFSMEYVDGRSLSDLLKKQGRIDPTQAAGYVLQAARGLKYAHDRGMVHRDVKPDNLMLNGEGVVKVADLGLVKTPGSADQSEPGEAAPRRPLPRTPDELRSALGGSIAEVASTEVTQTHVAMGTPAYMAPEQAHDAARVDARADVYSLGCTLYALLSGRPPFEGRTALETISKHVFEPVPPLDRVVGGVSPTLTNLVGRMLAKRPEDRAAGLGEVIQELEGYLGQGGQGGPGPREADAIEAAARAFASDQFSRWKPKAHLALHGGLWLLAVVLVLAGGWTGALAMAVLSLLTAVAYVIVDGAMSGTYLFRKVRQHLFGGRVADWLTVAAGLLVVIGLAWALGLVGVLLLVAATAVGLAFALYFLFDRRIEAARVDALAPARAVLRDLRLKGMDEEAIRAFVARHAGRDWEAIFEALFGYEAKLAARASHGNGDDGKPRPRHAAWRDPAMAWIDAKEQARREAKERKHLEKVEEKRLEAKGENLVTARRKARRAAEAMVGAAAQMRDDERRGVAPNQRRGARAIRDAAERPEEFFKGIDRSRRPGLAGLVLEGVLGPRARFLLGAGLLAGCALWIHQNKLLRGEDVRALASEGLEQAKGAESTTDAAKAAGQRLSAQARGILASSAEAKPLELPMVPSFVTGVFKDFNPGIAGLLLIASSFFRGWRMSLLAVPAAALAIFGDLLGMPSLGPIPSQFSSLALAAALAVVGYVFGRTKA